MTPPQIADIRSTFTSVQTLGPAAATLFYNHLFEADPTLRPLFRGDMDQQGQRLLSMIGAAVGLLDKPQQLLPVLQQLGRRHGHRVPVASQLAALQPIAGGNQHLIQTVETDTQAPAGCPL